MIRQWRRGDHTRGIARSRPCDTRPSSRATTMFVSTAPYGSVTPPAATDPFLDPGDDKIRFIALIVGAIELNRIALATFGGASDKKNVMAFFNQAITSNQRVFLCSAKN